MIARVALVAAVALGCGKGTDEAAKKPSMRVLAKMSELADLMCACKPGDRACAEKVTADITKWSAEQAKTAEKVPDPEIAKQLEPIMTRMNTCLVMASTPVQAGSEMVGAKPPALGKPPHVVEALVKAARTAAAAVSKDLVLVKLDAKYLKADGALDPTYGTLALEFRMTPDWDKADRPIGAPAPPPPASHATSNCPTYTLAKGAWTVANGECAPKPALVATCTAEQVWKRALEDGAEPKALASLAIAGGEASWSFSIVDAPRGVNMTKSYPDKCEPVVEKPAPVN